MKPGTAKNIKINSFSRLMKSGKISIKYVDFKEIKIIRAKTHDNNNVIESNWERLSWGSLLNIWDLIFSEKINDNV